MRSRTCRELTALVLLVGAVAGCEQGGPPEIAGGMDGCASCGMVIQETRQAASFTIDKEHSLFCSSGCLLQEYESRRKSGAAAPDEIYFADSETGEMISSEAAAFVLTERVPTVMNWGILAFGDQTLAEDFQEGEDTLVDWLGLRTLRGEVDRTLEMAWTPSGIEPERVELEKGELVTWVFRATGLESDVGVVLRGYEELGEILLRASGEPVERRMLAVRPGEGFPWTQLDNGSVLGQVRVRGAHTADEAAQ